MGTLSKWSLLLLLALPAAAFSPPPTNFKVIHYDLTVTPDFEQHSLSGESRITFRSLVNGLAEIRFSANALTVDRAQVSGQAVRATRDQAAETVMVFPRPLSSGQEAVLTVAYHGVPARGLVFGAQSVYTSYFTCDWMFCVQDRPGDKATIDLTLRLPRGMTSIGIGTRQAVRADTAGLEAHVWRETTPYSSYVYGFAAGRFQTASAQQSNVELTFLSESADPSRLRALFAGTAPMVKFFEEKAGVPLPHRRYVQVHVPGAAAQEAAAFSLIGDDAIAPVIADPQEDWAIAHELAHQWWGNLVTCADWNEFWLNEGLTTFMVAAWKEYRWGRASYDREMDLARQRADAAARAVGDVRLTFGGPFPSLAARRGIQYSKGAIFVDRLRRELGDEAFWRGLRAYTRAHVGSTVTGRDFQRAFERESGRDLQPLFREWVY